MASYVEFFVRTVRADLKRFAPATAQANINLEVLGEVAVPVAPLEERDLIVRRVQGTMNRAAELARQTTTAKSRMVTLESATLAKAFRGELAPQEANDEPA